MIKVLQKADAILQLVATHHPISFTELQRETGYNKATISLILKSMVELQWLERTSDGRFVIGQRITSAASSTRVPLSIRKVLEDAAGAVSKELNELVTVAVYDNGCRRIIARHKGDNFVQVDETASSTPESLFTTATGLVLLATLEESTRKMLLRRHEVEGAKASVDNACRQLAEHGFCELKVANGDAFLIAVPVYDTDAKPVAAIGFSAPSYRFDSKRKQCSVSFLQQHATSIQRSLRTRQ